MDQPNIILIVLDTLRKDVLPMYGGNTYAPNLTKYAKDAIVYPNPVAPSPWTLPSHMSIFTGFYSIEHGVHEDPNEGVNKNAKLQFEYINKTITHMLKEKGYTNIGFSANGWISEKSIFADNFDYFLFQEHSLFLISRNFNNNLC
jgi:arylsulfatase A-like enzyme